MLHRPAVDPIRHARLTGKHQVARWSGAPRCSPRRSPESEIGPPRFDPAYVERVGEVELRPLLSYEGLLAEVAS